MALRNLPVRRKQFWTGEFANWLIANGAELGRPTNIYEVIRYRAFHGKSPRALTHIVYAKENGLLNYQGASRDHYIAFLAGQRMPMLGSKPKPTVENPAQQSLSAKQRAKLIERDGDGCWFCGLPMGDDMTIEHLVPKSAGGGNKLANYALAHGACNRAAGNKPLVEKIEMRAALRVPTPDVSERNS